MHPLVTAAVIVLAASPAPTSLGVQPKARAYTLETSAVVGGAVLRANDHVDIVAVLNDDKRLVAVTLLQNVIVLANASPAPGEPRQLSLLVLPEEAELLALAKASGQLSATLRNEQDPNILAERAVVTVRTALTGERVPMKPGTK
ncbi:MAG: RcpC/CpaB family pilus assembly protein [Myxococcota bacterium]|jgi:Flp pilus assembly protein CpaB